MKPLASLLTTTIIAGSVWGLVHLQPAQANSAETTPLSQSAQNPVAQKNYVIGVNDTIDLASLPTLWQTFIHQWQQQKGIPAQLDKIVVLYRDISPDFSRANVTIGFLSDTPSNQADWQLLPEMNEGQILLNDAKHSEQSLIDAWQKISLVKPIEALVEIHYLDKHGLPQSSRLSVYYK